MSNFKYNNKTIFKNEIVNYLTKRLLLNGKKHIINKIFIKLYSNIDLNKLDFYFNKYAPYIELRKKKKGAINYNIPLELNKKRRFFIFSKWLKKELNTNKTDLYSNLNKEINKIILNKSNLIKKTKILQTEVLNNRLYLNYRW